MKLKLYQVDAFTDRLFSGNPAAVCPLEQWLPDQLMQNIATENNLAETAFYVKNENGYEIRWFTPSVEIDLCGHATLASAYIIFFEDNYTERQIDFHSKRSGKLSVSREGQTLSLNFPADVINKVPLTPDLMSCFDVHPLEAYKGKTDFMLVFDNEDQVRNIRADLHSISRLKARGVIITAKGSTVDFVSRFFAPQSGIDEDPVTGSAHTTLTPYWYGRTGKKVLVAKQLSPRSGELVCIYSTERILISGKATLYLKGEINVE